MKRFEGGRAAFEEGTKTFEDGTKIAKMAGPF
jgi:hypothetical protein